MADEQTSSPDLSLLDLANRITALEAQSRANNDAIREVGAGIGESIGQLRAIVIASQRVAQAVTLPPPAAQPTQQLSTKKDAWGKPLDAKGNVVALPPAAAPAPAAEAPAECDCPPSHIHGANGCIYGDGCKVAGSSKKR